MSSIIRQRGKRKEKEWPPRCGLEEEKKQWDTFNEMELYFADKYNEDIRVRQSIWGVQPHRTFKA